MENFIKELGIVRIIVMLTILGIWILGTIINIRTSKRLSENREILKTLEQRLEQIDKMNRVMGSAGGTGRPIYLNDVPEELKNTAGGTGYRSKSYQDNNDINVGGSLSGTSAVVCKVVEGAIDNLKK